MKWYVANHDSQGLIIDEETGRTIAVSYDKADAGLIASAPDLLDACKRMMERLDTLTTEEFSCGGEKPERGLMQAAINKAEATP